MAAIVNVCVDPRLNHETIRRQVAARLERMRLSTEQIFITNDIGGNAGGSLGNTVKLLVAEHQPIVMAAVLHHDDCLAARAGRRSTLANAAEAIRIFITEQGVSCPILTGNLLTESSLLTWTDEPLTSYETLRFRMPRMFTG